MHDEARYALRAVPGVRAVTPDTSMEAQAYSAELGYDPATHFGSMYQVAAMTGALGAFMSG